MAESSQRELFIALDAQLVTVRGRTVTTVVVTPTRFDGVCRMSGYADTVLQEFLEYIGGLLTDNTSTPRSTLPSMVPSMRLVLRGDLLFALAVSNVLLWL